MSEARTAEYTENGRVVYEKCYLSYADDQCIRSDKPTDGITMDGGFYFAAHRECVFKANERLWEGSSPHDPRPSRKPAHLAETFEEWVNGGFPYWFSESEMDKWLKTHFNQEGDWIA